MAGWLQRFGHLLAEGLGASPPDPMDPRFWGAVEAVSRAGENVTANSALQLDVVQSVLGRIAGTLSTLPLMLYERVGDPTDENAGRRPAREHPVYKLLHRRPNERQTAQEFRDELSFQLCYWRNAYVEIVPGADGPIGSLELIHPSRIISIERKADRRVYYTVRRLDGTGQDTFRDDELLHIRKSPLTADGLRGQYMYETARETFGKAQAVETFGALFFRNGTSGGGTLEHPGNFTSKEARNDFMEAWREAGGGNNRQKDRLLLHGVKFTAGTVKNDESQFIETLKEHGVKICRLWGFPPHMAAILDKATFSNIEQQSIEYVVHCIAPWISAQEQGFEHNLLIGDEQDRYFIEFNVAGLLRGDFKTRWAGYALGRSWGWLSVNDVLRLENMKPIGAQGDEYLKPLNMTPAGTPGADGSTSQPAADPADDQSTKDPGDDA